MADDVTVSIVNESVTVDITGIVVEGILDGATGATDNALLRADGTGGATIQGSPVVVDDAGSMNIPAGQKYKIGGTNLSYSDVGADASGSAAAVQSNLTSHANATGTAVHGLGTASTHADTDFDAAGAASAVQSNLTSHTGNTSNPHSVTKTQVGLSNVPNVDATNPSNITQDSTHRFATDTEKSTWNGKQDALGYTPVPNTRTVNSKALSADITLTASDVGADASGAASSVQSNLTSHINATGASVHGLGTASTRAYTDFDAAGAASGVQSNLTSHVNNTSNPHSTTYSQVGAEPANANIQLHISATTSAHGGIVASSDPRLTDSRTPTAHASTHGAGSSDALGWTTIHGKGTTSAKPAASSSNTGYIYFDTDLSKLQRSNGSTWEDIGGSASGTGDVVGPSSAVDSNIAVFNTTTGKLIKDSGVSGSSFNGTSQLVRTTTSGELPTLSGANLSEIPFSGVVSTGVAIPEGYNITLDKILDYVWSSGRVSGFAVTDNGDGTVDIASGVVMLRSSDTMTPYFSPLYPCSVAAVENLSLTDNTTNFIYAQYHATTPTIAVGTDITAIHATDKVLLYVITRVGTQLDYIGVGSYASDFMAKYAKKTVAANRGPEHAYGCLTSEVDIRKLLVTAGSFYYVNEPIPVSEINTNTGSTFTYVYRAASPSTYTRVAAQTTIDNLNYDDGTGSLATLDHSKYGVHWVFLVLDTPTRMLVVYGQAQYANVASAEAAGIPTDLPPEVRSYSTGVLIARVIVRKSADNLYSVQNPFTTLFHSSVATTHNGLSNLQGGTVDEYYHLTSAQNSDVANATNANTASTIVKRDGSGNFTAGTITAATPATGDNSTKVATTAFVAANSIPATLASDTAFTTGILNINTSATAQRVNTTISFDDYSHVFTIAPAGGSYTSFDVYLSGVKTTFNSAQTIDLDTVSNAPDPDGILTNTLYFIYFHSSGGVATLAASKTPWEINSNAAPIATVFWNGTNGHIGDERHDARRNLVDHKWAHQNIGTRWTTGFEGTFGADGTFSLAAGRLADEDIVLVSSGAVTTARIWYTTTGPTATVDGTTSKSAYISGGTTLQYNRMTDYTLQNVASGYFVRNYIYGTNDTTLPVALIVGQAVYDNLNDARNDPFPAAPTYINNEVRLLFTTIWTNAGGTATFVEATDYRTSPTQANGTLAARPIFLNSIQDVSAPSPTVDQVLTWNGAKWISKSGGGASASAGITFYSASPVIKEYGSSVNITQIRTASRTPVTTAEQNYSLSGTVGVYVPYSAALHDTALGRTVIDAGNWQFVVWALTNSTAGGRTSTLSRAVYVVSTQDGGSHTITTSGAGATTRTATASGGTPFASTKITADGNPVLASYLQTGTGLYQITGRTSDTVVTIAVPAGYNNETTPVAFNVWSRLFITSASASLTTTAAQYSVNSTQPAFSTGGNLTITAASKLGFITFLYQTGTASIVTTYYDGTARQSYVNTPFVTTHNTLAGLQGGVSDQYYHLSSAQYSDVSSATNANTASTIVKRDSSGNFSAGSPTFSGDVEVTDASKGIILKSGSQRIRLRVDYTDSVPQIVFDIL